VVPDDFKEAAELQEEEEKAQTAATTGDATCTGTTDGIRHLEFAKETVAYKGVLEALVRLNPELADTVAELLKANTKVSLQHSITKEQSLGGVWEET
jgi:hypothetical protein